MVVLFNRLKSYVLGQLGKCTTCMRLAFAAALVAALLAVALTVFAPGWPAVLAWLATFGLTVLWIAHVGMFVNRSVRATALRDGGGTPEGQRAAMWPRRKIFAAFIGTLLFSAAPFVFARKAHAQGSCNCYLDSGCRCPPAFPNCVYNITTREAICCGPNTKGCATANMTWCCPTNTNCSGDRDGYCVT